MLEAERLAYESHGEGEAVLFIDGALVAGTFLPLTHEALLADRYQLICYHRRGYGGSDPVPAPFSHEEQARDALALVKHLGVERVHVVGHSSGGLIAVQVAIAAPEVVHSLVLLELPPTLTPEMASPTSERMAPAFELYGSGDPDGAVDSFLNFAFGPDWRNEVANSLPGGPQQAEKDAATAFEVEFPATLEWAFDAERASRIGHPVLYVVGGETEEPIREPPKQHFRALVPQTQEVVLPGLNHLLHIRAPRVVAASIADFLERHPMSRADA